MSDYTLLGDVERGILERIEIALTRIADVQAALMKEADLQCPALRGDYQHCSLTAGHRGLHA